jgi:hypothetical protein
LEQETSAKAEMKLLRERSVNGQRAARGSKAAGERGIETMIGNVEEAGKEGKEGR